MAAVEAQPISILPAPAEPTKTVDSVAQEAIVAGPGPHIVTDENAAPKTEVQASEQDAKTTTTINEVKASSPTKEHRNPLGNILNSIFPKKEGKVKADKAVAKPAEVAPVAPEPAQVQESAKTEPTEPVVASATEDKSVERPELPKKKESFVDKIFGAFGDKKEKSPKKSSKDDATPEVYTDETAAAPVSEEAPKTDAEKAQAIVEAPVAAVSTAATLPEPIVLTEAPKVADVSADGETDKAAAVPVTPVEDKGTSSDGEDKKKIKIGRRLSARFTGLFNSPKKEKVNPIDAPVKEEEKKESTAADPAVAESSTSTPALADSAPMEAKEVAAPASSVAPVEEKSSGESAPVTALPLVADSETAKESTAAIASGEEPNKSA